MGISTLDHQLVSTQHTTLHPSLQSAGGLFKRAVDHGAAFAGGLLVAPLLLGIAALIKLDSEGPVLFKQRRVGVNGEEFWMYKFRTMHVGAEDRLQELQEKNEMDGPLFKMKDDPRATRVGKWLRRSSLDELPQLLNVLRGEMSLVGPRPPLPSEVEKFESWHRMKFAVRPGLTGLWQVSGRSDIETFDEMIALDLSYVNRWSLALDLKILLKTIPVVISCVGAR